MGLNVTGILIFPVTLITPFKVIVNLPENNRNDI